MIEIFQTNSAPQTEKHYSAKRTLIPVVNIPSTFEEDDFCSCILQCIPCLPFFTDEVGTDEYKNDFFDIYQNSISGGSHEVAILVDGVETTVTDNTYGTLYEGSSFYGYRFEAFDIWTELGQYGQKIQGVIRNYDANDVLIRETYSPCFLIQRFSSRAANKTIVLEFQKSGKLRSGNDYSDLSLGGSSTKVLPYWRSKLRLPGRLKETPQIIENSELALNDQMQSRLQIMDSMTRTYDLEVDLVSESQIMHVILDSMFANKVLVTDYNVYNFEKYQSLWLKRVGMDFPTGVVKRKKIVFKMENAERKYEKYND